MAEYNINCEIARDLMPLVIDDIASPSTRGAVKAHLAGCESCRKAMETMRRESASRDGDGEDADTTFLQFSRKLAKRIQRQHSIAWICGVLAVLALILGGWRLVRYQCYEHQVPMKFTEADTHNAALVQDQFGNVLIRFTVEDEKRPCIGWSGYGNPTGATGTCFSYAPMQPAWPQWFGTAGMTGEVTTNTEMRIVDGQLVYLEYDPHYELDETGHRVETWLPTHTVQVAELWLGSCDSDDALLLWKAGDPVDFPVVKSSGA